MATEKSRNFPATKAKIPLDIAAGFCIIPFATTEQTSRLVGLPAEYHSH